MATSTFSELSFLELESSQSATECRIVQMIPDCRFPTFLLSSPDNRQFFSLKVFPYIKGQVSDSYKNEIRFINLSHPHISAVLDFKEKKEFIFEGEPLLASYIIREASPFGTLGNLLSTTTLFQDEKLLRTYFQQLIKSLEYLHSMEIAHMDLKPSNLLIGPQFKLKIVDFDSSYMENDTVINLGTRNFRPPELRRGKCKDPFTADIYSAAIIFYFFKYGYLPYLEDPVDKLSIMEHPMFESKKHSPPEEERDFLELFKIMTHSDYVARATIGEIKRSKWFNGPIYDQGKLMEILTPYFKKDKEIFTNCGDSISIISFNDTEISSILFTEL